MHALGVLFALVASTCAYRVTRPNGSNGWTNSGAQLVMWERVSTDPVNFTIVLINQNPGSVPFDQVLVAEQDGINQNQTLVNPPSGGWPTGTGFRVNLVQNPDNLATIYAQSNEFTINGTTSSTSLITNVPTASFVQGPVSSNASPPPTDSDGTIPANNGAATITASAGLMALLGAITYFAA